MNWGVLSSDMGEKLYEKQVREMICLTSMLTVCMSMGKKEKREEQ